MDRDNSDKKPILQVKNITKVFPGVKALSDVSIDFYPGEVHALCERMGPESLLWLK